MDLRPAQLLDAIPERLEPLADAAMWALRIRPTTCRFEVHYLRHCRAVMGEEQHPRLHALIQRDELATRMARNLGEPSYHLSDGTLLATGLTRASRERAPFRYGVYR